MSVILYFQQFTYGTTFQIATNIVYSYDDTCKQISVNEERNKQVIDTERLEEFCD